MVGWVFNSDTFILIGDFNIMHPDIKSPQINTIKSTLVAAPDD